MNHSQVQKALEHLFRRESGKITAHLTRFFGPKHLDLAENVVQEAFMRAVQVWPDQGIPDHPKAWILRVAKNAAIDQIRSGKWIDFDSDTLDLVEDPASDAVEESTFMKEVADDQLKLMFICCHPILATESRIALTLKTICGFSVKQIAKCFLCKEETIAQRLVRAKQKIAKSGLAYEMPGPEEIEQRLDAVFEVLYLLFNEGYVATEGDSLMRRDLCEEAIYRTSILADHPICGQAKAHALLALMCLQISRFDARIDSLGEVLLLEEQNRSQWDQELIARGLYHLEHSACGNDLSDYHLQAGIASCHAVASSFAETDWSRILIYYDILLARQPSPVIALNRAVAIAMIAGPAAGLREVDQIKNLELLNSYYLLYATQAELHRRNNCLDLAKALYESSLALAGTTPERRLIQRRIDACASKLESYQ